jgi:predicted enzyme related to lactoylglutathione lyase
VTAGLRTMIYPVKDLAAAKGVYTALLGEPMFDAPYYVGWRIGNQDIGLDPSGHAQGMTGALGYYEVEDIEATLAALTGAGAEQVSGPRDVGGGKLIAVLKDADGNTIGLSQSPS